MRSDIKFVFPKVVTVIVSLFIFLFWNALENKKAERTAAMERIATPRLFLSVMM
jgi:hypothetical protein